MVLVKTDRKTNQLKVSFIFIFWLSSTFKLFWINQIKHSYLSYTTNYFQQHQYAIDIYTSTQYLQCSSTRPVYVDTTIQWSIQELQATWHCLTPRMDDTRLHSYRTEMSMSINRLATPSSTALICKLSWNHLASSTHLSVPDVVTLSYDKIPIVIHQSQ